MSDGNRLIHVMREIAKQPEHEMVDMIVGEVLSVDPLKVKVENREIPAAFLILGALVKETRIPWLHYTVVPHTHVVPAATSESGGSPAHTHGVKVNTAEASNTVITDTLLWRGLIVGDKVMMIRMARGQKYYIMQRLEGIIP